MADACELQLRIELQGVVPPTIGSSSGNSKFVHLPPLLPLCEIRGPPLVLMKLQLRLGKENKDSSFSNLFVAAFVQLIKAIHHLQLQLAHVSLLYKDCSTIDFIVELIQLLGRRENC
ncbi:unnamed protein product [Urochloa humidicola]